MSKQTKDQKSSRPHTLLQYHLISLLPIIIKILGIPVLTSFTNILHSFLAAPNQPFLPTFFSLSQSPLAELTPDLPVGKGNGPFQYSMYFPISRAWHLWSPHFFPLASRVPRFPALLPNSLWVLLSLFPTPAPGNSVEWPTTWCSDCFSFLSVSIHVTLQAIRPHDLKCTLRYALPQMRD